MRALAVIDGDGGSDVDHERAALIATLLSRAERLAHALERVEVEGLDARSMVEASKGMPHAKRIRVAPTAA